MSHELRTPLNAILGFAQLLEMDSPTAEARESIEQILKGGQHLLGLINEVLDIARIEAGRLAISTEPVAVAQVVREALDLIRPVASQQGVQIEREGELQEDWRVLADSQRLRQVLLNLLSNGVKYNRPGGGVTLACAETMGGRVRLSVRDTGPGIPSEKIAQLFTPFERLGLQHSGVEGTGIGLALSKSLVELMEGDIGVESVVGEGSTFWVELPLAGTPVIASVP
jgi:signal transduction histidine kinase